MEEQELIRLCKKNEREFSRLFCNETLLSENILFYSDENILDMYDHNFCFCKNDINNTELAEIKATFFHFQYHHMKISLLQDSLLLNNHNEFKKETVLVMAKDDFSSFDVDSRKDVKFKNLKDNPNIKKDLIELEIHHYGKKDGLDFTKRKMERYFDIALQNDNNFNFFTLYFRNKLVCSCYAFDSNGVICIDNLLTDEDYRHQNMAQSLIIQIANYFNKPLYLHAFLDEDSKGLYSFLRFKTIYKEYQYLCKW